MAQDGSARNSIPESFPDALHNPSCGCDWCQMEPIGGYRGTPPGDTRARETKAE